MNVRFPRFVQAEDAVLVDSSDITIEEVVDRFLPANLQKEQKKNHEKLKLQKLQASASASNVQ